MIRSFVLALVVVVVAALAAALLLTDQDLEHPPHAKRPVAAHRQYPGQPPGSNLEGFGATLTPIYTYISATQAAQEEQARQVAAAVTRSTHRATVAPVARSSTPPQVVTAAASSWDVQASCETGGNWQMQGSRFSGGLGFANSTWQAYGGGEFAPNAGQATREQQIQVAERIQSAPPSTPGNCKGW